MKEIGQRSLDARPFRRVAAKSAKTSPRTEDVPVDKQLAANVKVGRNAPCPCGSGRKYKKCCGQKVGLADTQGPLISARFGTSRGHRRDQRAVMSPFGLMIDD